jgi:hypothetical protein
VRHTRFFGILTTLAFALLLAGCQDEQTAPTGLSGGGLVPAAEVGPAEQLANFMEAINATLDAEGAGYRAYMAEAITDAESGEVGIDVLAKHTGNKQLEFDFVPGDDRREWSAPDFNTIDYAIDGSGDAVPFAGGLTQPETDAAIVRGHDSWEALSCANLGQNRVVTGGVPLGVIAGEALAADVQHGGWRDLEFSGGVIGATFTFGFCEPCSPDPVWTDIDGNGKNDAAFREIYYDPFVGTFGAPRVWADDGVTNIDVESVAVHETGHGLSQGHFGMVFVKKNGSLMRSPLAVMNAIYSMPFQILQGTDNGGHCSIWANWPQN